MKERPILFSALMVRAILKGCKTQTRRVVKPVPSYPDSWEASKFKEPLFRCPYGQPGDLLWVRETWATSVDCDGRKPSILETPGHGYGWPVWFPADDSVWWRGASKGGPAFMTRGKWRPSIHMPRWASRINLVVKGIRVERLQQITEADALDEGMEVVDREPTSGDPIYRDHFCDDYAWSARASFESLWRKLHGFGEPGSWDANPWVWVVEFEKVSKEQS